MEFLIPPFTPTMNHRYRTVASFGSTWGRGFRVFVRHGSALLLSAGAVVGTVTRGRAAEEIVLGMSTALSGPAAALGLNMRQGMLAGFERANRAGGVRGRRIRLVSLDDGYEAGRTAPNMRRLLEEEKVLAVVGNVGTPTAIAALPIIEEHQTLFYGAFTGAGVLRKTPPDRHVINYRASYAEEIGAMVDALIDGAGLRVEDIAFFTQRDGYGDAGFSGGVAALKRHGLRDEKAVLHVRYERNTLAVEGALASLLYAPREPRAVVMVGAYAPCAQFIRLATAVEFKPVFLNVSFVGSRSLAEALGPTSARVIVTQVVPNPHDSAAPMAADYRADLAAYDAGARPGFGSFEGYVAARVLLLALEKISGPPTRKNIVAALEGLGEFDVGLGAPLRLGPQEHQASHRVWPTILKEGALVSFAWNDIAGVVAGEGGP
jgi:ABC-type branched-subunit amino acid transport system substrate-binding protein